MKIRKATKKDIPIIWKLTRELAAYEKFLDVCTITKAQTATMLFGKRAIVECYLIEDKDEIVGMGKLMTVMETFSGLPFFLLRDFMVAKKYRNKGYGKRFLEFVVRLSNKRGYYCLQWNVLDWNKPTIAFYKKTGATTIKTTRMQIKTEWYKKLIESKKMNARRFS